MKRINKKAGNLARGEWDIGLVGDIVGTQTSVCQSTIFLDIYTIIELFANLPIDAMARSIDVANKMGDGKSMGYDFVAGVTVLVVPPSFFSVAVGDDDDDIVPTDTAFAPTSPSSSFAKRCEDGSGGNPIPSLFTDAFLPSVSSSSQSSALLARNTTSCALFKFANDLAVIFVVEFGERSIGNLTIVVAVVVVVVVFFTMVVQNASTEEEDVQSERRIIASRRADDTAMLDFMGAVCCVAG